jgi:hypothetical protein
MYNVMNSFRQLPERGFSQLLPQAMVGWRGRKSLSDMRKKPDQLNKSLVETG